MVSESTNENIQMFKHSEVVYLSGVKGLNVEKGDERL